MIDLEVQRASRTCAASGQPLGPGQTVVSTLVAQQGQLVRRDYSQPSWEACQAEVLEQEGLLAWWQWVVPDPQRTRPRLAPREVLLEFFEQLEGLPDQQDTRYVLALLLLRRRILRDPGGAPQPGQPWTLECPSRNTTYHVTVQPPSAERIGVIQAELQGLLEGDGP